MRHRRIVISIAASVLFSSAGTAQLLKSYQLTAASGSDLPPSNVINEIIVRGDTLWFGTERGLARTVSAGDSWQAFGSTSPFDGNGISAIAASGEIIWTATAYSIKQQEESLPAGGGLFYSTDQGSSWTFVKQPVDTGLVDTIRTYGATGIRSLAITTEANNLSYDLAVTATEIWTANFAGMLRRSSDRGATWRKVVLPPDGEPSFIRAIDTLDFDLAPTSGKAGLTGNLNHRVFSVHAISDSVIWVGTAGGINKTTDGGWSWKRFSQGEQPKSISGNFVVAIREQRWNSKSVIWAATVNAESQNEQRGVSFTEDGGATWSTTLLGEFAHNLAVKDSIIYIATDNGLFRSDDLAQTWTRSGTIFDPANGNRFASSTLYSVAVVGDTVWVGGPEGTAYTVDRPAHPFASVWRVIRTYSRAASSSETYSYPSPFAMDDEPVRLHYRTPQGASSSVTIRIFDFAMSPVRLLLHDAVRTGGTEHDDLWDGTNDQGSLVANGVYFYRIEIDGQEPVWGKILAIK